ncbi:MAG: hypothetical protein HFE62_03020 [Firmicutes bacterium]|nr:hypothetical protein [Bacillota bacterium]
MKIGGSGANKEITITDELTDGMQVTVNGKTYEFVKDGAEATKGKIAIAFKEGDAAANAQALFDAIQANDATTAATATITGAKINLGSETVATDANSKGLTLQVGDTADNFQKVNVVVKSTSAASLGIDGIDISTQDGASAAIDKIKAAINQVSSTRGDLGATQNRLEHTINNLGVTTENLTAAESRIRDTDMAEEMMNYTKNNILVQAAQAMLAQANTVPQGVLQLLQ